MLVVAIGFMAMVMGTDTTTGHWIECANSNNALMRCCWWFNDYMPSVCADAAARWLCWLVMKWTWSWWSSVQVLWTGSNRIGELCWRTNYGTWLRIAMVMMTARQSHCEFALQLKLHSIAKKFVIAIECPSFCLLLQSLCLLCLPRV